MKKRAKRERKEMPAPTPAPFEEEKREEPEAAAVGIKEVPPGPREWVRRSTAPLTEIQQRIDRISSDSRRALEERYKRKYGEPLRVPEMYEAKMVSEIEEEEEEEVKVEEEVKEAEPEVPEPPAVTEKPSEEPVRERVSVGRPWYSFKRLMLLDAVKPRSIIVKVFLLIPDVILWIVLFIPRVVVYPFIYFKRRPREEITVSPEAGIGAGAAGGEDPPRSGSSS
jgi:hypothetical protein